MGENMRLRRYILTAPKKGRLRLVTYNGRQKSTKNFMVKNPIKRKFVLVNRDGTHYKKKLLGTDMFTRNIRSLAKKAGMRPDKTLKRGGPGTYRRGDMYIVLKGKGGKPSIKLRSGKFFDLRKLKKRL
jgi:hypothetical protein